MCQGQETVCIAPQGGARRVCREAATQGTRQPWSLTLRRHTRRIQIALSSPEKLPGLSRALPARISVDNVRLQVVPIPVLTTSLCCGGRQHRVRPSRSPSGGVATPAINKKERSEDQNSSRTNAGVRTMFAPQFIAACGLAGLIRT